MSCGNIVDPEAESARVTTGRTVVVGLGNPILGDDGVGWRVAQALQEELLLQNLDHPDLEVICFCLGGLSLMEQLVGYERAIIVDAVQFGLGIPGQIHELTLEELPELSAGHTTAVHDTSLQNALRIGRLMGADLPREILIIGIEAQQTYDFSESLSPAVEAAIPQAVRVVVKTLRQFELA